MRHRASQPALLSLLLSLSLVSTGCIGGGPGSPEGTASALVREEIEGEIPADRQTDYNGDGYADLVVSSGARLEEPGTLPGLVHLYYGGPSGLPTRPSQTIWLSDGSPEGLLHGSARPAGDLNGDGFDDLLVGAPMQTTSSLQEGRTLIYYGGPRGLSDAPAGVLRNPNPQRGSFFGNGVPAGDVNGDGYDDIAVPDGSYDGTYENEGIVYLYLGSRSGVRSTPDQLLASPRPMRDGAFGARLISAGDTDGDGLDELAVTFRTTRGGAAALAVSIHRGTTGGLSAPPRRILWNPSSARHLFFGEDMAQGDLNGDGHPDLAVTVGYPTYDGDWGFGSVNVVYVYLGRNDGLPPDPSLTIEDPSGGDQSEFGAALTSGQDLDGDGRDELVVGAPSMSGVAPLEGRAFVYRGFAEGLAEPIELYNPTHQLLALYGFSLGSPGDVDGDGHPDLAVGALLYDGSVEDEGAVFVHRGGPEGGDAAPSRTLANPLHQGHSEFGRKIR